ncbi:penicillin-binding protein 2 [bacterium]|nr:penicillin-binding protein 2 [bacterium]
MRVRVYIFYLFILTLGIVLIVKLYQIQVVQGEYFRELAEGNRIRLFSVSAPRGEIIDRKGRIMAKNRPSFTVSVIPFEGEKEESLKLLSKITGVSYTEIKEKIKGAPNKLQPVNIVLDADLKMVSKIKELEDKLPGVLVTTNVIREYPNKSLASHILGYVGEVSKEEMEVFKDLGVGMGDIVGKAGIERTYQGKLMGVPGGEQVEVDAMGRPIKILGTVPPIPGSTLVTTIDLDLQKIVEESLHRRGLPGAIVVMDPRNGDILAMASYPDFNPNSFARGITSKEWRELLSPKKPLLNRAISAVYPPGSTFKIVVALAALAENVVDRDTTFYCPGSMMIGNRRFRCWTAHGRINFLSAIAKSCDVTFYTIGLKLGAERIARYAKLLGLGEPTGIDIPGEVKGLIPEPSWKKEPWYIGDTANMSIGQGYVQVTPIQMAVLVSAIANGGKVYKPRIVSKIINQDGTVEVLPPILIRDLSKFKREIDIIREGMELVVKAGTGSLAKLEGITVAGKTGTAENFPNAENPLGKDHAWFIAYAPADNPRIALSIVIEQGGHGGSTSAPISAEIINYYLTGEKIIRGGGWQGD